MRVPAKPVALALALAACLGPWSNVSALVVAPDARVAAGARTVDTEPSVAVHGAQVVVAWAEPPGSARAIDWGYSLDGGVSWSLGGQLATLSGFTSVLWPRPAPTVCVDNSGWFTIGGTIGGNYALRLVVYRGREQNGVITMGQPVETGVATQNPPPFSPVASRLVCDPERGYLYFVYAIMDQSAGYPYQGFNSKISVHVVRSLDGGATWSAPQQLSPGFATHMPTAAVGPDGELVVVWQDYATNQMLGRESLDFGATFGTEFIAGPVVDSRVVKPVGWQIGDFVAPTYSWIRQVPNPPALAIDRTTGPNRGRWYLSWTERPQGIIEPADSVVYEVEPNDDASRATPISVGQTAAGFACATHVCGSDCDTWVFDGVAGQTLFIDPVVTSGNVALSSTGLYCERTPGSFVPISGAPYRYSGSSTPQFVVTLPSTGRYAIYMCGSSFSIAYQIALHNVVLDASGPALDYRDIVLTSSIDHGASWGPRVRVNDDAPRFDNTFPALAVDDLGRLHAAWYDRRDDPTCGDEVRTYWTWSEDGGASFKPSLPLSRQPSDWGLVPNNGPVENRLALAATPMGIVAAWSQVVGADASDIFATVVTDLPTGIEVSGLAAELAGEAVRVRWTVGSVANVTGFEVERASGSGSFLPISGFVAARGEGHYEWLDSAPPAGAELRYRIAIHHESGLISYEGPVILERPAVVREFAWRSLGPNPFTRELQFAVATPHLGAGDVGVFDVAGHAVRSLHQGALAAGMNQFRWDGADAGGRPVPPGVYLLRARFEHTTLTRRVIRIE